MSSTEQAAIGERDDLVETLRNHRYFLRYTVRDLTDEQAARRTHRNRAVPGRPDQARRGDRAGVGQLHP